ncbi:MAG: hypothetical protein WCO86_19180, partial [Planctomycetota bacterium]
MLVLTLFAVLLAPPDAKISMLNGQTHGGALSAISAADVEITENGALFKLPLEDVMAIEFPQIAPVASVESQMLFFFDGSQLHGSSIARTA